MHLAFRFVYVRNSANFWAKIFVTVEIWTSVTKVYQAGTSVSYCHISSSFFRLLLINANCLTFQCLKFNVKFFIDMFIFTQISKEILILMA